MHEIDALKRLTVPAAIQLMQEAGMQHAIKLKVSAFDLEERQFTWMLIKKSVEIFRLPILNETITVETYPSGFDRILAFRDFKCYDAQRDLIATGASCWALINTQSKQLSRFPDDIARIKTPEVKFLERPNFKIKNFEDGELIMKHTINKSEVDWNKHLNNAQLNKLILSNVSNQPIRCYNIQFKNEALLNEDIQIFTKSENGNRVFKVWSATEKRIVALAELRF